jgi:hypothetical protein
MYFIIPHTYGMVTYMLVTASLSPFWVITVGLGVQRSTTNPLNVMGKDNLSPIPAPEDNVKPLNYKEQFSVRSHLLTVHNFLTLGRGGVSLQNLLSA